MTGPHRLPCETPPPNAQAAPDRPGLRWVLPATILGSSLGFIDAAVVNVALPAMQRDLATPIATMQWVANGYMLTLASLILLGGSAGDRFGRKRVFLAGLVAFAAASLACGLAPSAAWLVIARLAQGVAAALLVPSSLAIISEAYTGDARGRAIGTWAGAAALTTALGPPIGGWLVDAVGWRAIFLINLPVAGAAVLLALKLPQDVVAGDNRPLDARGAALAVATLGLLSYGLIAIGNGEPAGWIALAAALPAGWLFLRVEARSAAPMVPLALFADRSFAGANALTVLLYAALGGVLFLLPFMLIRVHGYSAADAGAAFLPFSAVMGIGSRPAGGLIERFGARLPLVVGPGVTAAGFALLAVFGDTADYWRGYLPGLLVVGVGMTIAIAPLTTTVFDSAPANRSGVASGINNAAARAAGLVAVAALGLAFGGAEPSGTAAHEIAGAYPVVMAVAAALAALAAATAAVTIAARAKPA